jgi:hypothetical protein
MDGPGRQIKPAGTGRALNVGPQDGMRPPTDNRPGTCRTSSDEGGLIPSVTAAECSTR